MEKTIFRVKDLAFLQDLFKQWKVFVVGGFVRDSIMKRPSKDIDILVVHDSLEEVAGVLKKHGRIDMVGEHFAAIKFKPKGWNLEPIDVVIPRRDTSTGDGHKDFNVETGKHISLEDDLVRRDFTINAIAIDAENYAVVDPFNGVNDINKKILKAVNPDVFVDDPLRMLRGIQFAARFGFDFDNNTWWQIRNNVDMIKNVSAERVLDELDKIWYKRGDFKYAMELMLASGIHNALFDNSVRTGIKMMNEYVDNANTFVKTRSDFYYIILSGTDNPAGVFKRVLRGGNKTVDGVVDKTVAGIRALTEAVVWENMFGQRNSIRPRCLMSKLYSMSQDIFESGLLCDELKTAVADLCSDKYPRSLAELAVDGNDMMELGFKGSDIGTILSDVMKAVFEDIIPNDRGAIMKYIKDLMDK